MKNDEHKCFTETILKTTEHINWATLPESRSDSSILMQASVQSARQPRPVKSSFCALWLAGVPWDPGMV